MPGAPRKGVTAPVASASAPARKRYPVREDSARASDGAGREPLPMATVAGHTVTVTATSMAVDRYYRGVCDCGEYQTRPCGTPSVAMQISFARHLDQIKSLPQRKRTRN